MPSGKLGSRLSQSIPQALSCFYVTICDLLILYDKLLASFNDTLEGQIIRVH